MAMIETMNNNISQKSAAEQFGTLEHPHTIYREGFGTLLSQISDPPKQLYVAGNHTLLTPTDPNTIFLCVIGSRKYTDYGKTICQAFMERLRGLPIVIVSGLALGIDSIAHRAAIDTGLPTIAVPGSGLHPSVIYPRSHLNLAREIIDHGGLILSEYDPLSSASHWSFPVRNRIMAGLSHKVLIIEAEENSGTLITAHLALDYNREVLTVPGSVFSSTSKGPHSLLRRGAIAISSGEDLLEALGYKKTADTSEVKHILSQCSAEEKTIIKLINEPLTRDEICARSAFPPSQVQILLSMLEIRKLVKEEYGKICLSYPL